MQSSFSEPKYADKKNVARRDRFLAEIKAVAIWTELVAALGLSNPEVADVDTTYWISAPAAHVYRPAILWPVR